MRRDPKGWSAAGSGGETSGSEVSYRRFTAHFKSRERLAASPVFVLSRSAKWFTPRGTRSRIGGNGSASPGAPTSRWCGHWRRARRSGPCCHGVPRGWFQFYGRPCRPLPWWDSSVSWGEGLEFEFRVGVREWWGRSLVEGWKLNVEGWRKVVVRSCSCRMDLAILRPSALVVLRARWKRSRRKSEAFEGSRRPSAAGIRALPLGRCAVGRRTDRAINNQRMGVCYRVIAGGRYAAPTLT